jgi:hypothetical protein
MTPLLFIFAVPNLNASLRSDSGRGQGESGRTLLKIRKILNLLNRRTAMKALTKYLAGAATVAALTVSAASPAAAQSWDRHDRDGIDVGDIATGVAIVGGIAALISAFDNDGDRYGYGYDRRYGYDRGYGYGYGNDRYRNDRYRNDRYRNDRYGYGSARAAVNACGREAQRYGGNVEITDIDRDDGYYRVRGRILVRDYEGRGWNRRADFDRERFTCLARNGRIYDFRV